MNSGELGLLAIVIVKASEVDLLAVLPLTVHLERAVADGRQEEALEVVLGSLGNRSQRGVRAHIGEVCEGRGELDHEGVVVRAGHAGELSCRAVEHLVIALDEGQVIRNDRRGAGVGVGVADALPAVLEALGGNGLAVMELGAALKVEGELGGVVIGLPGIGNQALELLGLKVIGGQRVEQLELDLRALRLLRIVGVDADGIVDVEVDGGARSSTRAGIGAALLAAGSESCESTGRKRTADKCATAHHQVIGSHKTAILSN